MKRQVVTGSWLAIKELANQAEVPEPTARRYLELFAEFFQTRKIGRSLYYAPGCTKIMRKTRELFGDGLDQHRVRTRLEEEFPQTFDTEPNDVHPDGMFPSRPHDPMLERLALALEGLAEGKQAVAAVGDLGARVEALETRVRDVEEVLAEVREGIGAMLELLKTEELHE
jgi:hypothetical protein